MTDRGMIQATVPSNRSGLSILSTNPIINNGDEFREDGYVYDSEGTRVRKWFVPLAGGRLWEPKLKDVALLEAKRWKWCQRRDAVAKKLWAPLLAAVQEKNRVYGYRTVPDGSRHFGYVQYDGFCPHLNGESLHFNWAPSGETENALPEGAVLDQEAFDLYWAHSEGTELANKRYGMIRKAFERAVDRYLHEKQAFASPHIRMVKTVINGREYWWELAPHSVVTEARMVVAPEDTSTLELAIEQEDSA